jgi:microcystin degradation protein MlrC
MKPGILPLLLWLLAALVSSCAPAGKNGPKTDLPRIAIAGIAIESSTFSPAVTHEDAFHARYDYEVFSYYPFLEPDSLLRKKALWLPAMRGHAMPGGIVTREAYESMVQQILERLENALPLDGLFLDIHGAMSVVGIDDPEGDFLVRIRELVGTHTLISTCMDLHGSVSPRLAQNTDLITCFRMAPHEDALLSKQRAVENLLYRLENGLGKPPYKVWIPVPILLPGEKTSTRVEPGKSLYAMIEPLVADEGVTDASIWMSYPWADEPRNHGVVMAYGDNLEQVKQAAEKLAQRFWDVRHEFEFVAPTAYLDECVEMALAAKEHPFIISDMGDNPTAGGAGDVTWTLHQLLSRKEFISPNGPSLIYASLPDEEFVAEAVRLGIGSTITAAAGARVDNRFAPPVKLTGKILTIVHGDSRAETEVVVQTGSIRVIVTKKRKAYHYENDFIRLGLDPRNTNILVVKIGYLVPELYDMRAGWIMALTPGGVDQDLERLPYKRIQRPMYPLDKDMPAPDLKARLVPLSDEIKY